MPTTPEQNLFLERVAAELQAITKEIRPAIETLKKSDRGIRKILKWATVGLVFDLILSVGLGWNAIRTERALVSTAAICESTNELRATVLELRLFRLQQLSALGTDTEEQKRANADYEVALRKQLAPRDC